MLTVHQFAAEATQVHGHYLKGASTAASAAPGSSSPTRRTATATCTATSCALADTPSEPTVPARQCLSKTSRSSSRTTTPASRSHPANKKPLSGMLHHEFDRLMAAETEELERVTANRDRLEREQDRLMQAHYADAVPLSVLKREQDRIAAELDQVTRRIDARAHLDDALGLLANCADIYTRCDDTNRRLCNQASFTKVFIDEDNELRVEHNRPFEMLLAPGQRQRTDLGRRRTQGPNLDQRSRWQGFEPCAWVELRGFEPLTFSLRTRRATNCAIAPGTYPA